MFDVDSARASEKQIICLDAGTPEGGSNILLIMDGLTDIGTTNPPSFHLVPVRMPGTAARGSLLL